MRCTPLFAKGVRISAETRTVGIATLRTSGGAIFAATGKWPAESKEYFDGIRINPQKR
jgi:hypothetical protein